VVLKEDERRVVVMFTPCQCEVVRNFVLVVQGVVSFTDGT
jgi:hypothetical protein